MTKPKGFLNEEYLQVQNGKLFPWTLSAEIAVSEKVTLICGKSWIKKYMKEDLKNVIITFGLIAFVFTGGFFTYREKVNRENILTLKQELQNTKNENLAKIEQNRILEEKRQLAIQAELKKKQLAQELLAINSIQDKKLRDQALAKQAQAQALLQQQQAQAQAQVQQQASTVKPSRTSRAS
jgi:hypothetical protein